MRLVATLLLWAMPCFATFSSLVGSITQPASNSTVTHTLGGSLTPTAIIFWSNHLTAAGSAATMALGSGFCVSGTDRSSGMTVDTNALVSTSNSARSRDSTASYCIDIFKVNAGVSTLVGRADFSSFGSGSVSLVWTSCDGTQRVINFIAFFGTAAVKTGTFATKSSAGSLATTGVGFQPDLVFTMFFASVPTNLTSNSDFAFSAFTSSGGAAMAGSSSVPGGNTNPKHYQRAHPLSILASAGTLASDTTLTSMDSDGWTFNYTTSTGSLTVAYLALQTGGNPKVGTFTEPTAAAPQTVTVSGITATPAFMLVGSVCAATSTTIDNDMCASLGASDGTHQFVISAYDQNGVGTISTSQSLDQTNIAKVLSTGGASPTVTSVGAVSAVASGSFDVTFSTTRATAGEWMYVAVGATASSTPTRRRIL